MNSVWGCQWEGERVEFLWGSAGHRPLLSCPRNPLSLGLQCSLQGRAREARSATSRLSSGPTLRPSSPPISRKVRPTCRAGHPQPRSRSGTHRACCPRRTRDSPARNTVWTHTENCHQGPERSIPRTCTFNTDRREGSTMLNCHHGNVKRDFSQSKAQ